MRSLRARLTVALVGLAGVSLILAAVAVYSVQRSLLYDRLDGQLEAATAGVRASLVPRERPPAVGAPPAPSSTTGTAALPPRRDGGPDAGRGRGRDRFPAPFRLPPGTYGQRRDAAGRVLSERSFSFDSQADQRPNVPARLALSVPTTVEGRGKQSPRYRALATPTRDGGSVIAAIPLDDVDATLRELVLVQIVSIAAALLLLALAASRVVSLGLRPLVRMAATADQIADGDLSRRVEDTDAATETGRLGLALNAMLGSLQAAFAAQQASEQRLRQFLADASHELRTPLTSIRGYAELHRMGALSDPAQRDQAMQRVEDEAERMGVLVSDLLALARLDEVQDAPHGSVDLTTLVHDAAADTRAAAPDREVTVHAPEPVFERGAEDQLRQVLANLCANARSHTPAGTAIELTVAVAARRARVTVRDHGAGLPPGDASQLFERFWRAEGGRTRGSAGAGLGLAIVAAVVRAHGGTVHAEDAPGGGATFVVELAAASADAGDNDSQETLSES